ncbi:hypothetical protein GRS96_01030 [Rathayibacter sp. VKM Ac-2803]|uniref:hypothetical protein n=1 Tax=unclassified Rathayibacter TaxID=2609250 RepID=UPI0013597A01|nr:MULTISPECIES: hypothetical protein [unclassified Rathayibacter]MWV47855.1 hypothetical protein [Rathayibacter sp. VKM Ac-2803]MWV58929.1 hypothetical protein [Rathayibacter sp. VKM Ac-2754]
MAPLRSTLVAFDARVAGALFTRSGPSSRRHDVLAIATAALVNERYLDRRFTIAGLSRELRVSALVLRLRFRRFYALPLEEHLASRRLELASILMARTPHRPGALEDIARHAGYRSAADLDRDFVRYRRTPALAAWFRMGVSRTTPVDEFS